MKAKTIQRWAGKAGVSALGAIETMIKNPGAYRGVACVVRLVLTFFLARAVILEGCAPFGLAFVAASGAGLPGLFSMLGALVGYLTAGEAIDGLRYLASAILIYAAAFVFRDTGIIKRPFFMPLAAIVSTACLGFVFVAEGGFAAQDIALFITELILVGGCSYFYRLALEPVRNQTGEETPDAGWNLRRSAALLVMAATLALSFSSITFWDGISPGRALALLFVMMCAWRGGAGAGSAAGVSIGLALDLGSPQGAFFSMAYGFSGLLSGVFQATGKLAATAIFLISHACTVLWSGDDTLRFAVLIEAFIASVLFMLIPDRAYTRLGALFSVNVSREADSGRMKNYLQKRIEIMSLAFQELFENLTSALEGLSRRNSGDVAAIFDRTSDRVCRRCALAGLCWDREAVSTYNTLNDVTQTMMRRGEVRAEDFPPHFSSRCLHFSRFVTIANEELVAFLYRRQFGARLQESRSMVCAQYGEISRILKGVAGEFSSEPQFDPEAETRLDKTLRSQGISAKIVAYRNHLGRTCVDIEGKDLSPLMGDPDETLGAISGATGCALSYPEQQCGTFGQRLHYIEAEPYSASVGTAAHRKRGETVSGDSATYFKCGDGKLYILLADGMGSGREASLESGLAVRLMERFLKAGVQPEIALKTLASTFILRSEASQYVTIDLICLNLFTGELVFYKSGAAPSYMKRGRRIHRITCNSMPAGAASSLGTPPMEITRMRMGDGEYVVLISDGITDSGDDLWLQRLIAEYDGQSPRELAAAIVQSGLKSHGPGDDMTVFVLRLDKFHFGVGEDIA